jgi:hypothetical protein
MSYHRNLTSNSLTPSSVCSEPHNSPFTWQSQAAVVIQRRHISHTLYPPAYCDIPDGQQIQHYSCCPFSHILQVSVTIKISFKAFLESMNSWCTEPQTPVADYVTNSWSVNWTPQCLSSLISSISWVTLKGKHSIKFCMNPIMAAFLNNYSQFYYPFPEEYSNILLPLLCQFSLIQNAVN